MEGAALTPPGTVRAELWVGYGSIWEQDSTQVADLFLDMERVIKALTVRVGLAGGLEVGARATVERTGGGFLDGAVLGFHSVLGAGDRNRRAYPRNAYGQWLRDGDGTLLVEIPARTTPTLEDVRLFARWGAVASPDGHQAVTVTVLDVDLDRNRIALSMKKTPGKKSPNRQRPEPKRPAKPQKPTKRTPEPFNNPFADAFR